jgi:hypothetical protein
VACAWDGCFGEPANEHMDVGAVLCVFFVARAVKPYTIVAAALTAAPFHRQQAGATRRSASRRFS